MAYSDPSSGEIHIKANFKGGNTEGNVSVEEIKEKGASVRDLPPKRSEVSRKKADENIKLDRRRRRCPVVNADRYACDGDMKEGKEERDSNQRSIERMVWEEDVAGLLSLSRTSSVLSETDVHGWTALHWACSRGSVVLTHAILQEMKRLKEETDTDYHSEGTARGVDGINAAENLNGWTPLHLAAIGGHVDVVYLLMEAGCDTNVKDRQVGDRPINCIKRVSKNQAAGEDQTMRLRNALLDLSDCEGESSHGLSSESLESSNVVTADKGQRRTARKKVDGRWYPTTAEPEEKTGVKKRS